MDNAQSEFTKDDHEILGQLNKELAAEEQQQPAEGEQGQAPAAAPAPVAAPAPSEAPAVAAAPAPAPSQPQGDVRAALRAARRGEQAARDKAAALEREVADLKAKIPAAPAPASTEFSDEELAELRQDMPAVAKVVERQRELDQRLAQAAPAPSPAPAPVATEFVPTPQRPEVQEAIDETPELLAWQNDRDQTNFDLAVLEDTKLRRLPAWKDKPLHERLAEAARRVKADLTQQPAAPTPPAPSPAPPASQRRDPASVIAAAPTQGPASIGDFKGGASPAPTAPDYRGMSDEAIMASLPQV